MNATAKKVGILEIFKVMFSSEPDIEDYESVTLPKELSDVRKKLEVKESEVIKGFNSSNKGGFAKKINPKTEEAMRAMHSKVVNKQPKISDREERE